MVPSLLALSDVMGTGWFAADAANVKPARRSRLSVSAVGLLGVLSAKQMGAERIIVMSRHESRQKLAREFGATDIVTERGDEGVERIKELTNGIGADSVLECVGTQESMVQAIQCARRGGHVGYVGVPHGVGFDGEKLFYAHVHSSWRTCASASLLARPHQVGVEQKDQSRQDVRPDLAARSGGGALPRNGRAPRNQDAATPNPMIGTRARSATVKVMP